MSLASKVAPSGERVSGSNAPSGDSSSDCPRGRYDAAVAHPPDPSTSEPEARPLRADAERNRRKIIDAARELFAERGLVSLDEVAERAGVGVGTVYRRFPSRDDLVDALYYEAMEKLVAVGKAAVERSETDPWGAIEQFLTEYLAMHAADKSLSSVVLTDAHGRGRLDVGKAQMAPMGRKIVERARAAGVVRDDFAPSDMPATIMMLVTVMNATRELQPDLWRRYLAYLLDSFRPEAASAPLPADPLPVDRVPEAMRAVFSRTR